MSEVLEVSFKKVARLKTYITQMGNTNLVTTELERN